MYWAYRCWQCERELTGEDLSPVWRAWFTPLTLFSLLGRIRGTVARELGRPPRYSAPLLGGLHLLLVLTARLPDPWWLVNFAAVLPLLPGQAAINRVAAERPRFRLHPVEWAIVLAGGLLFVLALIGTLWPDIDAPPLPAGSGTATDGLA
jgi:hypothetical protein